MLKKLSSYFMEKLRVTNLLLALVSIIATNANLTKVTQIKDS